jgi:hypothetical protein
LPDDMILWNDVCAAEQRSLVVVMNQWNRISEKDTVLTQALETPHQRGAALRLLLFLGDDMKARVFPTLIDLASVGHSDIGLCRMVIKSMPRRWVIQNIEPIGRRILDRSNGEEEYRRLAELYIELDSGLLERHVKAALSHANDEIREVGSDFEKLQSSERTTAMP